MNLRTLPDSYAVVRLQPGSELPEWVDKGPFRSVTRTDHEVSVVCRDHDVPEGESVDRGWTVLEVMGPLDFSLSGVIASLVQPLAECRAADLRHLDVRVGLRPDPLVRPRPRRRHPRGSGPRLRGLTIAWTLPTLPP